MLKNLFGDPKPSSRAPDGLRLYAVGDIHGSAELLDRLIDAIDEDARNAAVESRLIFLGDYIDRGPASSGVIERLLTIQEDRPGAIFLKGNHEAAFLEFLNDPWGGSDWLGWGGAETLLSYGVEQPDVRDPDDVARDAKTRLPDDHLRFLQSLALYHAAGEYLFVHAGLKPGTPLEEQTEADLLWIRGEFHNAPSEERPPFVVVHGHHPMKKPLDAGWRIAVDTGACFSGRLTAVVLEGDKRRFIST